MENLRISGERLWASLMEMAKIGATPKGGVNRQALTDLDRQSRELFTEWCEAAGCSVSVDAMGNMFARRPGRDNDLPPVMTGSHLDTQPTGGKFDGAYGVMAGLEVIRTLNDLAIETEAPVEVAVWTNEEGCRFAPSMVGSGVFAGKFTLEEIYAATDPDGRTFGEELEGIGYKGELPAGGRPVGAFFEVHIEQGPVLEREDKTVGVVRGAQGLRWYDITVRGRESHAGTTPMESRKDALAAAAEMIAAAESIAVSRPPHTVVTVGMVEVRPNSRNTIPGEVYFTIDLRHPEEESLADTGERLAATMKAIAERRGVVLDFEEIVHARAVGFDPQCVAAVRAAAERAGYSHMDVISGAGHDACYMAGIAPTAMVFIPCADGISHNEIESATPEDAEAGCNVLLHAILDRAGTAS